jgi:hypothetical protein
MSRRASRLASVDRRFPEGWRSARVPETDDASARWRAQPRRRSPCARGKSFGGDALASSSGPAPAGLSQRSQARVSYRSRIARCTTARSRSSHGLVWACPGRGPEAQCSSTRGCRAALTVAEKRRGASAADGGGFAAGRLDVCQRVRHHPRPGDHPSARRGGRRLRPAQRFPCPPTPARLRAGVLGKAVRAAVGAR